MRPQSGFFKSLVQFAYYMKEKNKNWLLYGLGFVFCFFVRLLPFRSPNIEPVLAFSSPFSRTHGTLSGFVFGFMSIVLFDSVTSGLGMWTVVTAFAYGIIGAGAHLYFKNKSTRNNPKDYAVYAFFATIAYDAITGLTVGPLFFHQPFMNALVGQVPFTMLHLVGNVTFAFLVSPFIYHVAVKYPKFSFSFAKKLPVTLS